MILFALASVENPRPQDAAQFFSAAIRFHPDYSPALLNLATVEPQYLRDDAQALKNYRAYLALTPRPADWGAVNDLVNGWEQPVLVAAIKLPPAKENEMAVPAKSNAADAKPPPVAAIHPPLLPKAPPGGRNAPAPPRPASPAVVVTVPPETAMVTAPDVAAPGNTVSPELPQNRPRPGNRVCGNGLIRFAGLVCD